MVNPVILTIERFVEKKSLILTILTLNTVLKESQKAQLMMAGNDPLLETSQQLILTLSINNAVDFPGDIYHAKVARTMQRARVMIQHSIQPSHVGAEGTPSSMLEVSASDSPVVSTRHTGIPEFVAHGQSGLLGDEGDVDRTAHAMIRLANDPQLASDLGQYGPR